jgi:hypothetical protein
MDLLIRIPQLMKGVLVGYSHARWQDLVRGHEMLEDCPAFSILRALELLGRVLNMLERAVDMVSSWPSAAAVD